MKFHLIRCLVLSMVASFNVIAQDAKIHYDRDNSERLDGMQAALVMQESDQKIFLPIYNQYEKQRQSLGSCAYVFLPPSDDVLDSACGNFVFRNLNHSLSLRKEYFEKINESLNGTIALQFLQSEAFLDLIIKSQLYEESDWSRPEWNPQLAGDPKIKLAIMERELELTPDQLLDFRSLFQDFEFEYARIVGYQLVWFRQCVENVSSLTPGQCKKLGTEFITMQQNEIRLREKFFTKINDLAGAAVAARYMAIEDYFTMIAKLRTWDTILMAAR